jgi:hypothetical protein
MRLVTTLALAAAGLLALSSGAQAVEINPGILKRVLPEVEHTPLPRVAAIHFAVVEAERYGTGVPAEERALGDLADTAVGDIYAVRDDENVDPGSFEAWRGCFEGMFKDAGERYSNAVLDQILYDDETGYPSWSADIEAAGQTCLNSHFGESPATHEMATIMGNQLGAWAQDASNTSSAAGVLANWFDNTASDLEDEAGTDTIADSGGADPTGGSEGSGGSGGGSGSGDGGGSSSGLLIGGVVIAGLAAVAVMFFRRKSTS